MKKIYISYDKKNKKKTDEIFEYLERNGISCFIAPDSIPEGETYASSVPKAIKDCDVFLLILSDDVQKSSWIPKEIELAIEEKKMIIPFKVEECTINDTYKFYLGGTNIVDGTKDYVEKLDEIVLSIKKEKKVDSKENIVKDETIAINEIKNETKIEEKKESKKTEEVEKQENVKPENGIGKYIYPNGNIYEGEWADGKRCGYGILTIKDICSFYALFNDDKAEMGIISLTDGTFTLGQWKKNDSVIIFESVEKDILEHPLYRTKKYKNGDEYHGDTIFGSRDSKGIYKYANGEKYIGFWSVDQKKGYGTFYYNNNDIYTGYWKHDQKEGIGLQLSKEGNIFFGTFKGNVGIIGIQKDSTGKLKGEAQWRISSSSGAYNFGQEIKTMESNGEFPDFDFSMLQSVLDQFPKSSNNEIKRKESGENQCPLCHGYGKISQADSSYADECHFKTCPRCNGKGKK